MNLAFPLAKDIQFDFRREQVSFDDETGEVE